MAPVKFLKTFIIVLFILSFSSAALSLYLSNIRENEKEKRIYLEGVKIDLEERLGKLELDKAQLTEQVSKLEISNQELTEKLKQEENARQEVLSDLETFKSQAEQAQTAFTDAQRRNQELERILDELETRMRQIEGQSQLPASEVGYLEVKPVVTEEAEPPAEEIAFKPLTNLPEPPKKRKKRFLFFGSKDKKEEVKPVSETTITTTQPETLSSVPAEEPEEPEAPTPAPALEEKPEPVQVKIQAPAESMKTDQAIAAGSVLLVNRKYNFVVINLGSRQSLDINDTVSIQQDGKEVAKARVEKVYDDYSAAYIIEEQSDHPIAEGNAVSRT